MSKKQLHNRLDNLFGQFEEKDLPLPIVEPVAAINWTWEVNQNWDYTSCGTEIINALGFTADDVIGQPFFRFAIHPQHATTLRALIEQGLFPIETELDLETKSGNWLRGRINIFKIPGENGSSNGCRGFFQIVSNDVAIETHQEFPSPISQTRIKPLPFNQSPISSGVSYQDGKFKPASKMWTSTGAQTLV
ncbi:MAG: PAS domain-containing protein, partial [Anaerolineaceae bacterium]|nr:PAS domain-containing protein [Anaerolineaceae bacterium]